MVHVPAQMPCANHKDCVTWRWRYLCRSESIPCPLLMLKIGDIFRVPYRGHRTDMSGFMSYQDLTRGAHRKSADHQKGMFFYQKVKEPLQDFARVPAFIFHSNPFKKGAEGTP